MDFSRNASSSSSRPTLPSLHALNLPFPKTRNGSVSDDTDDYKASHIPWNHNRQVSISSSVTSRSPSPIMPDYFATRSFSPSPLSDIPPPSTLPDAPLKVRLVPCSFESADAYIYVPPSNTQTCAAPKVFDTIHGQLQGSQPLLLVGSAARQLCQPTRKIVKGARLHPYRITRNVGTFRPPKKSL